MNEFFTERVAWSRRGTGRHFVGALRAGDWGINLSGRDPASGIDVTLSVPQNEIEDVHLSDKADEMLGGDRCVVVELAESDPILMRELGVGPLRVQALARTLELIVPRPALLAQGG